MENQLSPVAFHDLCISVWEELKAASDYRQKALRSTDGELNKIFTHIMCEELNHAAMQIAKIAKDDNDFACSLWEYLNADNIIELEDGHVENP